MAVYNYDKNIEGTFTRIDKSDTIFTFYDKVNFNFEQLFAYLNKIYGGSKDDQNGYGGNGSGDFQEHGELCGAILIKPHQPIHKRVGAVNYGDIDVLRNVDWLKTTDVFDGDMAIIEMKRQSETDGNDTFIFRINVNDAGEITLDIPEEIKKTDGESTIILELKRKCTCISGTPGEKISANEVAGAIQSALNEKINTSYMNDVNIRGGNISDVNLTNVKLNGTELKNVSLPSGTIAMFSEKPEGNDWTDLSSSMPCLYDGYKYYKLS